MLWRYVVFEKVNGLVMFVVVGGGVSVLGSCEFREGAEVRRLSNISRAVWIM